MAMAGSTTWPRLGLASETREAAALLRVKGAAFVFGMAAGIPEAVGVIATWADFFLESAAKGGRSVLAGKRRSSMPAMRALTISPTEMVTLRIKSSMSTPGEDKMGGEEAVALTRMFRSS